jgi:hypothetical protein
VSFKTPIFRGAKKTSAKIEFSKIVRKHPPSYWGILLRTIEGQQLKSWIASLIWWSYIEIPIKGEVVSLMESYNPHKDNPINDLEPALKEIGLPCPPIINPPMSTAKKINTSSWSKKNYSI